MQTKKPAQEIARRDPRETDREDSKLGLPRSPKSGKEIQLVKKGDLCDKQPALQLFLADCLASHHRVRLALKTALV